jgi:hypothetical protein
MCHLTRLIVVFVLCFGYSGLKGSKVSIPFSPSRIAISFTSDFLIDDIYTLVFTIPPSIRLPGRLVLHDDCNDTT